jgi:hypothetical protein
MAKSKKTYEVRGWLPGLEKTVKGYSDAYSEAQAIRNICIRYNLPSWAPKYLNAYEVKPNPATKHLKSKL